MEFCLYLLAYNPVTHAVKDISRQTFPFNFFIFNFTCYCTLSSINKLDLYRGKIVALNWNNSLKFHMKI